MGAKSTFQDITANELEASKLNFNSFNIVLSASAGLPVADASIGALYVDTNSGNLYRKTASGSSNWIQISSITSTVFQNHYRNVLQNSVITATDAGAASLGDLVGIYGAGSWSAIAGTVLSVSRYEAACAGSQSAAVVAGGENVATVGITSTALFNGIGWTSGNTLTVVKYRHSGMGSQNAALMAGGLDNIGSTLGAPNLFNGTTWVASNLLNLARYYATGAGTQNAAMMTGGQKTGGVTISSTELFNGSSWFVSGSLSVDRFFAAGAGSQNAAFVTAGAFSSTELFNGSTWSNSGFFPTIKQAAAGAGSQNAAIVAGGLIGSALSSTELFNGSTWSASGNLAISRSTAAGAGSQNSGLVVGGNDGTGKQNSTELHAQATYRKLYSREYNTVKSVGILINSSQVQQQGSVTTSVIYVPNKWLITNRYMNSISSSDASLTGVQLTSIQGSAPTPTYNFSATILSVVPGMMAIVTSSGATPAPAADYGTFLITRVINPASIELTNSAAIAQNPATGTISFISTMLAVDTISPQDIVIGRTDENGYLIVHKPITIGSLNRRLK